METKAKWDLDIGFIAGVTLTFIGGVYLSIAIALFTSAADAEAVAVRSVFLPLGLVFLLVGIGLLLRAIAKKRQADQLIAEGRYVWAKVTHLRVVRNINGFRGHPVVVHASYTDAYGQTHHFQSRHLYGMRDVSILGESVKVYIQGSNYGIYYMDPEPLLQRTNLR